jgi:acetyl esterase/lipase
VIRETTASGVLVRVYNGALPPAPAVIYCHAGAFMLGNLDTDHRQCVELARRGHCSVVSVDYRLAPEHPYPVALDDAARVLNRRATYGDVPDAASAGARRPSDRVEDGVRGHSGVRWSSRRQMWRHYLGSTAPSADSVPARRDQLRNLATAFVSCSDIDPLRDEALD